MNVIRANICGTHVSSHSPRGFGDKEILFVCDNIYAVIRDKIRFGLILKEFLKSESECSYERFSGREKENLVMQFCGSRWVGGREVEEVDRTREGLL